MCVSHQFQLLQVHVSKKVIVCCTTKHDFFFGFRALYSMIQFTSVTLLYSFASSLGDFQVRVLKEGLRLVISIARCSFCTSICSLLYRLP